MCGAAIELKFFLRNPINIIGLQGIEKYLISFPDFPFLTTSPGSLPSVLQEHPDESGDNLSGTPQSTS